jgi:hypothetical protein
VRHDDPVRIVDPDGEALDHLKQRSVQSFLSLHRFLYSS